jgi:hypothetical protein
MYYNQGRRDNKKDIMKTKTRTAHTLIPKENLLILSLLEKSRPFYYFILNVDGSNFAFCTPN